MPLWQNLRCAALRVHLLNVMGCNKVTCANCGARNVKLYVCNKCQFVRYCGRDCQKNDWKDHKKYCYTPDAANLPSQKLMMLMIDKRCVLLCG